LRILAAGAAAVPGSGRAEPWRSLLRPGARPGILSRHAAARGGLS
jgi:hypothetical protein